MNVLVLVLTPVLVLRVVVGVVVARLVLPLVPDPVAVLVQVLLLAASPVLRGEEGVW
jgi:hypothetical protein